MGWESREGRNLWVCSFSDDNDDVYLNSADEFWPLGSCALQVARRCWSGNSNAYETIQRTMEENRQLRVTMPFPVQDEHVLDRALQG